MLKETILSLTEHEVSLIRTSISNYKKIIVNNIRCLSIGDEEMHVYQTIDLAVLNSIQEEIVDL